MEKYKNLNGQSGVKSYETGSDFIIIEFRNDSRYLYTYESAGSKDIELMKSHAILGYGLNTFINKYVKDKYARRLK